MNFIKNNKGLSLVETLVGITILSITGFGLLKVSQQTALTSQITQTHVAFKDLKKSVYRNLNDRDVCNGNLKPAELSDRQNKIGRLTDNALGTLNTGRFQEGLIEIVSMRLNPPLPPNQDNRPPETKPDKIFYLYYKYNSLALGDKQKRTDDPCTGGTNPDVKGCYYLTCEMNYECTNDDCNDPNDECNPRNCDFTEANIPDAICPDGEMFVGFDQSGNKECVGCADNQILIGIITEGGEKKAKCLDNTNTCPLGTVARGIKLKDGSSEDYELDCKNVACNSGEHIIIVENEMVCRRLCHGGQRLIDKHNRYSKCHCPTGPTDSMKLDDGGNCVCKTGKTENTDGNCVCPPRKTDDGNGNCVCGVGTTDDGNGNCSCANDRVSGTDGNCVCPDGKTERNGVCVCNTGTIDDGNGNCVCPTLKVEDGNGNCVCGVGTTDDGNGNCSCLAGKIERNGVCVCPPRKTDDGNGNCVCRLGTIDDGDGNCSCQADRLIGADGNCICPAGKTENKEGNCVCVKQTMPDGGIKQYIDNGDGTCVCPMIGRPGNGCI